MKLYNNTATITGCMKQKNNANPVDDKKKHQKV